VRGVGGRKCYVRRYRWRRRDVVDKAVTEAKVQEVGMVNSMYSKEEDVR